MSKNVTPAKYYVDGRIWINKGNYSFLGEGKIELIIKIKELGSLRKAAAEMKMSYRKAWQSISNINKSAEKPLVVLKRGGKDGGIAEITEYGEKAILAYQKLQLDFEKFLIEQSQYLNL